MPAQKLPQQATGGNVRSAIADHADRIDTLENNNGQPGTAAPTNLSIGTRTANNLPVVSSTGDDVNLPLATPSLAGIMSASDKTKVNVLGNFNPAEYAKDAFFEKANGLYIPMLAPGSFDNPSNNATNGLSSHASGGVVATTAGTQGRGSIYLPQAIDPSKPFRFAVLVEINDAQPIEEINFKHADTDYRSGISAFLSADGINLAVGGGIIINSWGNPGAGGTGIPVGTKVWVTVASDGLNGVVTAIFPETIPTTGMHIGSQGYGGLYDGVIRGASRPLDFQNTGSGLNTWGGSGDQLQNRLVKFEVVTKSTGNRIIGVWVNQNLGGPSDGRLTPPAVVKTNIYGDLSGYVVIPKQQGTRPIDLVMINHPNAFGTWDAYSGSSAVQRSSLVIGKLLDAGYCLFGLDGVYGPNSSTVSEATASNWGAPTGMKYRKGLWDFVRANVPGTRYIYEMGLSMGFLNSLRLSIQYPNQIRGIVGIGGVCDLKDCYDNRGFAGTINKAFATWYVSIKDGITAGTPLTDATAFKQITYGFSQPEEVYYKSPYVWRDMYDSGATYANNTVVGVPEANGSAKKFQFVDPALNGNQFKNIPIKIWHGSNDTLIPITQATNFAAAVNAVGGSVSVVTVAGGGHLSDDTFDPDGIVAFFNSLSQ